MKNLLPDIEPPITCEACIERLFWVREHIYNALDPKYVSFGERVKRSDIFALPEKFQSDMALRVSCADTLLAAILWTEAGRPPQEIVSGCSHEIKDQCVYALNVLLGWLQHRPSLRRGDRIDQGSMASAWIRLFAEFRKDLEHNRQDSWREP